MGKGNVSVTYHDMQEAATKLTTKHDDIKETLNGLKKYIKGLVNDGFVTEKASKSFEESFDEFVHGAEKTIEGLDGMADYLNKAKEHFSELDDKLGKAAKK